MQQSDRRSFSRTKEAWYAQPAVTQGTALATMYDREEFMFNLEGPGINGEFAIRWGSQGPRLEVYSDAWGVLPKFADVLKLLENWHQKDITADQMSEALLGLGLKDDTKRKPPKDLRLIIATRKKAMEPETVAPSRKRRAP